MDSSVVLRRLFREPGVLKEWARVDVPFSSRILPLECRRTLDRWRIRSGATDEEIANKSAELEQALQSISVLPLTEGVLRKAEQPLSLPLSSLDSLHVATALLWREKHGDDFHFATHDQELSLAAKAYGFRVIGL